MLFKKFSKQLRPSSSINLVTNLRREKPKKKTSRKKQGEQTKGTLFKRHHIIQLQILKSWLVFSLNSQNNSQVFKKNKANKPREKTFQLIMVCYIVSG